MDCLPVEVTCEAQVGLWVGVLMSVGGWWEGGVSVQDVQGGLFTCRGHL